MPEKQNYHAIGEKIRQARQQANLDQTEMAKMLGYKAHHSLSKMENGLMSPYKNIEQIAAITKKPLAFFVENNPHSTNWKAQKYDSFCQRLQEFFPVAPSKHYTEMTEAELENILGSLGLYTPFYQQLLKTVPVLDAYQEKELLTLLNRFRERHL